MLRPEFHSMPTTKSFKNYTKYKKSGKKIKTVCYNLQLLVWKMESGKLRHYKFNCKVKEKKKIPTGSMDDLKLPSFQTKINIKLTKK